MGRSQQSSDTKMMTTSARARSVSFTGSGGHDQEDIESVADDMDDDSRSAASLTSTTMSRSPSPMSPKEMTSKTRRRTSPSERPSAHKQAKKSKDPVKSLIAWRKCDGADQNKTINVYTFVFTDAGISRALSSSDFANREGEERKDRSKLVKAHLSQELCGKNRDYLLNCEPSALKVLDVAVKLITSIIRTADQAERLTMQCKHTFQVGDEICQRQASLYVCVGHQGQKDFWVRWHLGSEDKTTKTRLSRPISYFASKGASYDKVKKAHQTFKDSFETFQKAVEIKVAEVDKALLERSIAMKPNRANSATPRSKDNMRRSPKNRRFATEANASEDLDESELEGGFAQSSDHNRYHRSKGRAEPQFSDDEQQSSLPRHKSGQKARRERSGDTGQGREQSPFSAVSRRSKTPVQFEKPDLEKPKQLRREADQMERDRIKQTEDRNRRKLAKARQEELELSRKEGDL